PAEAADGAPGAPGAHPPALRSGPRQAGGAFPRPHRQPHRRRGRLAGRGLGAGGARPVRHGRRLQPRRGEGVPASLSVSRLWAGSVALFLRSLALRLAFLHGVDPRETLRADGWHYTMLAWSLAHRGAYSDSVEAPLVPHMRWPPGYPALLAPFYRGRDLLAGTAAALSVQVVAGAAIPVLTALTGARLGL